jgi:hypothetical protein
MFFYKKNDNLNSWDLVIDNNKKTQYNIYINKLQRKMRDYFKNLLETEFSNYNNIHKNTLDDKGLNIPEEEINESEELLIQLEDLVIKLNDKKHKKFMEVKNILNNYLELLDNTKESKFFSHIINKYIIEKKKLPYDFSAEYTNVKNEFNINLKNILNIFSNKDHINFLEDKYKKNFR